MRLLRYSKWFALGGAALWLYRQHSAPRRADADRGVRSNILPSDFAADPRDPVQGFDEASELRVSELDYDAMSRADAEAASDLAALSSDLDERHGLDAVEPIRTNPPQHVRDAGELYGVHTPIAADRDIPDGDASFDAGQNWIESLKTSATESGPEPEADVDVEDDQDVPPHPSDRRDIPVADRGSAGPRGV